MGFSWPQNGFFPPKDTVDKALGMYRGDGIEEYCDSSVQSLYCVQTMYLSVFFYTGAYEFFWFWLGFWFVFGFSTL